MVEEVSPACGVLRSNMRNSDEVLARAMQKAGVSGTVPGFWVRMHSERTMDGDVYRVRWYRVWLSECYIRVAILQHL